MIFQGKIIEYIEGGKFICAVCLQDKGSRLHLLTASNREVKISPKRAVLVSESSVSVSNSREILLDRLRKTDEIRNQFVKEIDIQELWELTKEEEGRFDTEYLSQLVFGRDAADDHLSALMRALFEDRLHFKMKDGYFIPNSEERVAHILKQREEKARRARMLDAGGKWLREILEGRPPQAEPSQKEDILQYLVQLALFGNEGPEGKFGRELLLKAGTSDIGKARELLIRLGVWKEDENLDILRSGIEIAFSPEQLEEAGRLAEKKTPSAAREDRRDLFVFTIDGPSTRDFDDAISLESKDDVIRLGIHIADVASMIPHDSILDQEAAKRGTSLYLPRREIAMMPHALSHNTLSLVQGDERPAISIFADCDKEGNLLAYRFVPTLIQVSKKLTYEQVDQMLTTNAVASEADDANAGKLLKQLRRLVALSQRFQTERMNQDALRITLPDIQVVFYEDGSFSLMQDNQETPARMIIAEMMIFYNQLAAQFCRGHEIPVLYRGQAEPSERLPEDEMDYIYYVFQQRRKLSPVYIDKTPKPHSGLGIQAYLQATSPIRRYLDLVVQRQIRNYLMDEPLVYTDQDLEDIRMFVEPAIKRLQNVKRNRIRYWILKYLNQKRGERFKAVLLDEFRRKYRVVLRDFYLIGEMNKRDGLILKPGEEILVKVLKADPWEDMIGLELDE